MSNSDAEKQPFTADENADTTNSTQENINKDDYGYSEYPERDKPKKKSFWSSVSDDPSTFEGLKCQLRVKQCLNECKP